MNLFLPLGSVLYSNSAWVSYVTKAEEREEAGTPAIIESIRCGLVFQLKVRKLPRDLRKRLEDRQAEALIDD
jgi:hypothetical protein